MTRIRILTLAALGGAAAGAVAVNLRGPWFEMDKAALAHRPFILACVAGLVVFSLYWDAAAKNSAPAKNTESPGSRGVHVFLVNLGALLEMIPIRGSGRFLPASVLIMAAGLAVEASGILLAVWARRHLGQNWSGAIAIKVEHQLIRSGPYRLLRHPIYTGLLVMYAGVAVVTGEWLALIGLAIVGFAYWRKIRLEEAALNGAFGPDYAAYRRETWALVPGLF